MAEADDDLEFDLSEDADFVDVVFLLHTCPFGKLQRALEDIGQLECINSEPVVFRIENLS